MANTHLSTPSPPPPPTSPTRLQAAACAQEVTIVMYDQLIQARRHVTAV